MMILTVIGARPQFVKAAVVSKALSDMGMEERVLHTGQHYDGEMSDVFWKELGIPPWDCNLEVGSGTHGAQTGKMLEGIERYMLENDGIQAVIVHGDTNSTVAAAMTATKMHIPVMHVESGLRSFNRKMPEEINRVITDHISSLLFCSSPKGVEQLQTEGITQGVCLVGDVMADAVRIFSREAAQRVDFTSLFPELKRFTLLTLHRPSNTDNLQRFESIMRAIATIEAPVLWPVHPRNKRNLEGRELPGNLITSRPLSYFEMLSALKLCDNVLTDSGGLQKEAYWMKKKCVTLRDQTEWVETLHDGWNTIVGAETDAIVEAYKSPLNPQTWHPLYGDGHAATKIAQHIKQYLENSRSS